MAKIIHNKKDFLIIQLSSKEATKLNFGVPITGLNNICLCGSCNTECKSEEIYYIAGINEVMCKDCCDDFIDNMTHYTDFDSLKYEIAHFNRVCEILDMNERAAATPNTKIRVYDKSKSEECEFSYT